MWTSHAWPPNFVAPRKAICVIFFKEKCSEFFIILAFNRYCGWIISYYNGFLLAMFLNRKRIMESFQQAHLWLVGPIRIILKKHGKPWDFRIWKCVWDDFRVSGWQRSFLSIHVATKIYFFFPHLPVPPKNLEPGVDCYLIYWQLEGLVPNI